MTTKRLVSPPANFLEIDETAHAATASQSLQQYRGRVAIIVGMLLAFLGALWTIVFLHLAAEKELVSRQAQISNRNVAVGIAEQTRTLSGAVDKLLLLIRLLMEENRKSSSLSQISKLSWMNVDFLAQIAMTNADGLVTDSNLGQPTGVVNLADRTHFQVQKNATIDELYISDPVIGRVSGIQTVQFTRGMRDDKGHFQGIIVASVDASRLSGFYQSINTPFGGWISLVNERGVVLAEALGSHGISMFGERIDQDAGTKNLKSINDSCFNTLAIKSKEPIQLCMIRVKGMPLWITFAVPLAEVFSVYDRDKFTIFMFAGSFSIFLLGLSAVLLTRDRHLWVAQKQVYLANIRDTERTAEIATVLGAIDEGILIVKPDGRIYGCNRKAPELLRVAPPSSGDSLDGFINSIKLAPNGAAATDHPPAETLRAPARVILPRFLRIDDRTIESREFMGHNGDTILVFRDITEQMRSRDTLKRTITSIKEISDKRVEFLAILSHEIRTPLHAIIGYAKLLSETTLSDPQRQLLTAVMDPADHLRYIVNDVLDFLNLEAGGMTIKVDKVDLFALCDRISPIANTLIGDKKIEFTATMAPSIPAALSGDEKRIFQILINLIGNAIKYTTSGHVSLDVSLRSTVSRIANIRFIISDTGHGIAADDLKNLFKPFERGAAASGSSEGVGLGLAICERIVGLMNGSIKIDSVPRSGTTVVVDLPMLIENDAPQLPALPPPTPPRPLRILVVEDNRASRVLMQKMLGRLGHDVTLAEDGQVAIDAMAANEFDLVLMDLQMPVLDGLSAAREIKRRTKDQDRRPLMVALTAQALKSDRRAAEEAGFDGFLEKPLVDEELAAILSSADVRRDGARTPQFSL